MAGTQYTIRRKVFTFFGAKFHIYDAENNLIGYCKQKAFKLKEDIRIYTDESMSEERLVITARKVIDFSGAYDVVDSKSGTKLGALRRKGFKSILRDSWQVLDENDEDVGSLQEDSASMALVRRFLPYGLGGLFPQKFQMKAHDSDVVYARFRTHFNLFVHRMTVTVEEECQFDPMLVLAAGILLAAIEGRQSGG